MNKKTETLHVLKIQEKTSENTKFWSGTDKNIFNVSMFFVCVFCFLLSFRGKIKNTIQKYIVISGSKKLFKDSMLKVIFNVYHLSEDILDVVEIRKL